MVIYYGINRKLVLNSLSSESATSLTEPSGEIKLKKKIIKSTSYIVGVFILKPDSLPSYLFKIVSKILM